MGIDGLLLLIVTGEGSLVVPVDFVVHRPDRVGLGHPPCDMLTWLQVLLDWTWAALRWRCRRLPVPLVVADSWLRDSQLLLPGATPLRLLADAVLFYTSCVLFKGQVTMEEIGFSLKHHC